MIADLRAGRASAAEHLNSAAEKGDPQVYVAALKDLVKEVGMTRRPPRVENAPAAQVSATVPRGIVSAY